MTAIDLRRVKHVPLHHRVAVALIVCIGAGCGFWFTHNDGFWKLFEFTIAPFVDKIIFGLGGE